MTEETLSATGGCYCGKVRYRASRLRPQVTECHCSQCRRQSGHRWAATAADMDDLEIEGADAITWFAATADASRGFCATCGSTLFWKPADETRMGILAASVDEPNGLSLAKHVFVESKGRYYEIDDGLPRFESYDKPVGA
jgi:hypothetical protein